VEGGREVMCGEGRGRRGEKMEGGVYVSTLSHK